MVQKKSQVTVYVRAGDPACLATIKTLKGSRPVEWWSFPSVLSEWF